ncbi:MAG: diacylglycerol kinase family protein [Caldilineaceae bacterium]
MGRPLLTFGAVLAMEAVNTAVEAVVDLVSPDHHPGRTGQGRGRAHWSSSCWGAWAWPSPSSGRASWRCLRRLSNAAGTSRKGSTEH